MAHVSLPITSRSGSDDNDFADVYGNDSAITTQVNGNLDNSNIAAGAGISHSKLANASGGSLLIANGSSVITATPVTGQIGINSSGESFLNAGTVTAGAIANTAVTGVKLANQVTQLYDHVFSAETHVGPLSSGTIGFVTAGLAGTGFATSGATIPIFRYDPTNFDLDGRTTTMVLRAIATTNATAPAVTLTVGLYPVTGISSGVPTLGTVVSGSTVAFSSPSANAIAAPTAVEFAEPSTGQYVPGVALSGTTAIDSRVNLSVQFYLRRA